MVAASFSLGKRIACGSIGNYTKIHLRHPTTTVYTLKTARASCIYLVVCLQAPSRPFKPKPPSTTASKVRFLENLHDFCRDEDTHTSSRIERTRGKQSTMYYESVLRRLEIVDCCLASSTTIQERHLANDTCASLPCKKNKEWMPSDRKSVASRSLHIEWCCAGSMCTTCGYVRGCKGSLPRGRSK
jgi:hypothetical protein